MGRGKSAASLTAVKLYAYNFRQREFEHSWQLAVGFYFAFLDMLTSCLLTGDRGVRQKPHNNSIAPCLFVF